jgi:hypothetical protein
VRSLALSLLLAWHLVALTGCVLVGREAKLYYPPAPEEGEVPSPPVTPDPATPPLRIMVSDARPAPREKLGPVRNAYGWEMSAVTSKDDVPAWITSALVAEFEAAGVRVMPPLPPGASDDVTVLAVEVQKVQCDAYFEYGADVILGSRASYGNKSWTATHHGQGGAGANWTATEASFSLSLSRALRSAARGMAKDVKAWLTAPPLPVGAPVAPAAPSPGS